MEATEDAATPEVGADVDAADDTTTPAPTAHPRNIYIKT